MGREDDLLILTMPTPAESTFPPAATQNMNQNLKRAKGERERKQSRMMSHDPGWFKLCPNSYTSRMDRGNNRTWVLSVQGHLDCGRSSIPCTEHLDLGHKCLS